MGVGGRSGWGGGGGSDLCGVKCIGKIVGKKVKHFIEEIVCVKGCGT